MGYFIRGNGASHLWHANLGLAKIWGDSSHCNETEVSGHQEREAAMGLYCPSISMKCHAKQCSYFAHTTSCPLSRRDFIQSPSCSGAHTGWLAGKEEHTEGFCSHAIAVLGASVQAISDSPWGGCLWKCAVCLCPHLAQWRLESSPLSK